MTQLWLRNFFMNMAPAPAPAPERLVFKSVALTPVHSFFVTWLQLRLLFGFTQYYFQLSWWASSWLENEIHLAQKLKEYTKLVESINLVFFYNQPSYHIRKSVKKRQSQVQTIQRKVNSRKVTQVMHFRKYDQIPEMQSLVLLLVPGGPLSFLTTGIKKTSVWKTTLVSEHFDTDQSQMTKCFAFIACFAGCSLGDAS